MMKTIFLFLLTLFFIPTILNAQMFKNEDDSLAYSLGVLVAGNLKSEGFGDLNVEMFSAGMKAALQGDKILLSETECQEQVRKVSAKKKMKVGEVNKTAGEVFLEQNKKKDGVITLADGLQYEVIKMGDGPKPGATDKVNVHYHGTLIDGTVFDSSVERGEPISFPLNQVIKGWTEVLQLMPVGSKWRVFIPYQLAYGDRGAGPKIQPYSALIFEIELLGIDK